MEVNVDNTLHFGRSVTVAYYMKHMMESMDRKHRVTIASWSPYQLLKKCGRLIQSINVSATTIGRFDSVQLLFSVDALKEIFRWLVEPLDVMLAAKAIPNTLDVPAHLYFTEGEVWARASNGNFDASQRIISVVQTREQEFPEEYMRNDYISVQYAKCSEIVDKTFDE